MTIDQATAFAILAGMMVLFAWGRIRYDLTALIGLLAAMAAGIVPVSRAFTGFGDQVVVLVGAVLIVSSGVGKSRVIGKIIRSAEPYMRSNGSRILVLTSTVALLSSFMKNIGALAIFLPLALRIARRSGTSGSILLMPMAFSSLIGGLVTLVGTSPNILVSRVREEILGKPFAMFDFAPVGIGVLAAGLTFLAFGWRLLPLRGGSDVSAESTFNVDAYVTEAVLPRTSPFVNRTVASLETRSEGAVSVVAIIRERGRRYIPASHWWMFAGDVLILQGDAHAIHDLTQEAGLELVGTGMLPGQGTSPDQLDVVEAIVMAGSRMVDCSPSELKLRDRYGVNLIAFSRPGQPSRARLHNVRFRVGDVLILQGVPDEAQEALKELGCLPLVDRATGFGASRKDFLPLIILGVAVLLIATDLVGVAAAFFAAAVLMILLRVLTLKEAYDAIDPSILILLACLIPISDAINHTGAVGTLADGLSVVAGALPPTGAIAFMLFAAMAVTPFLNNAATVLIMAPIAVGVASRLGLNPDPFLMAVAIGAACDFLTPVGHQCNTLVMGPGRYQFGDYWKLGLPLSIIVICVGSVLIPLFWAVLPM